MSPYIGNSLLWLLYCHDGAKRIIFSKAEYIVQAFYVFNLTRDRYTVGHRFML